MLTSLDIAVVETLARGRGLGRLIGKAMEGDPVAIGILGVVGVGVVGYIAYNALSGGE